MISTGAHTGRWTWSVRCRGRSDGRMLVWSMKAEKWAGCIITMRGERRDDMGAHRPVGGCDGVSGLQVSQGQHFQMLREIGPHRVAGP
jgi:hypothetical protein